LLNVGEALQRGSVAARTHIVKTWTGALTDFSNGAPSNFSAICPISEIAIAAFFASFALGCKVRQLQCYREFSARLYTSVPAMQRARTIYFVIRAASNTTRLKRLHQTIPKKRSWQFE
jgi:hypothetical protein